MFSLRMWAFTICIMWPATHDACCCGRTQPLVFRATIVCGSGAPSPQTGALDAALFRPYGGTARRPHFGVAGQIPGRRFFGEELLVFLHL